MSLSPRAPRRDTIIGTTGPDDIRGGRANETIYGRRGDDTLFGGDGDDLILGIFGNDVVIGGRGNDTLGGVDGNDVLIGGRGDDSFRAGGRGGEVDVICDFGTGGNLGTDRLDLHNAGAPVTVSYGSFAGNSMNGVSLHNGRGGDTLFQWTGANGQLVSVWVLDVNLTQTHSADLFA